MKIVAFEISKEFKRFIDDENKTKVDEIIVCRIGRGYDELDAFDEVSNLMFRRYNTSFFGDIEQIEILEIPKDANFLALKIGE